VEELGEGGLSSTLSQISARISGGNEKAAIALLNAFINQVNARVAVGKLPQDQGRALHAAADGLIAELSS
jgi:hypothetical protein